MGYSFGACLPAFASCADRFCLSGYGGGATTVTGMMDLATTVEGLQGVELISNWHVNDETIETRGKELRERGLACCMVIPDLWTQAKWGRGSLCAADPDIRQAAIAEVKRSMDWAAGLGCSYVDVWLGQDGYDYPLQADFEKAWEWAVEGLRECADHRSDVEVLVEYKYREPRTHIFINSAAKCLLLLDEVDRPNTGVLLDVGHALAGGENMAEAFALLQANGRNRCHYLHFNDNYRDWDDDMIPASVHLVEYLELFYWIRRTGYEGWLTMDIFPYREDGVGAARESLARVKALIALVDRIGLKRIGEVLDKSDAILSTGLVREAFLG